MPSKRIAGYGRMNEPMDKEMINMGKWKKEEHKEWDKFGKVTKIKVQRCETFCDKSECTEMEIDNEGTI